ncbi:MAG: hypothetical protein ABW023_05355 [Sphingomonas sp.]
MRRAFLICTVAALLLSGCNASPDMASNTMAEDAAGGTDNMIVPADNALANDVGPANATGPQEDAYCPAVDFATSAAQCRKFTQEKNTIEAGLGVFNPPREMVVGESRDLVLGVGRRADTTEIRESVGGNAAQQVEVRTPIGHHMTATLSGGGFDVAPSGPQSKTLSADRREVWQWRITAKEAGPQQLLLVISVDAAPQNGAPARYELARKPISIQVNVTDAEKRERRTKALEDKIGHGTRVLSALEKWLIALGAVIVALGGVWIGIRTFGKGKGKDDKGS